MDDLIFKLIFKKQKKKSDDMLNKNEKGLVAFLIIFFIKKSIKKVFPFLLSFSFLFFIKKAS